MGSFSKCKNLNNLRSSDFIINGDLLHSMILNSLIKGMMANPAEKEMPANELALKIIKQYDLQEINKKGE